MSARKPLQDAESAALREAARMHGGSRRDLAAALGMSERTLYRKLRALES
jgi:DNA-binding NtrC family response regulator